LVDSQLLNALQQKLLNCFLLLGPTGNILGDCSLAKPRHGLFVTVARLLFWWFFHVHLSVKAAQPFEALEFVLVHIVSYYYQLKLGG
jgi:hypothetical protein